MKYTVFQYQQSKFIVNLWDPFMLLVNLFQEMFDTYSCPTMQLFLPLVLNSIASGNSWQTQTYNE